MKNKAAQELGKLGGKKKSEAKTKAAAENGKKGGRPKAVWIVRHFPPNPRNQTEVTFSSKSDALEEMRLMTGESGSCSNLWKNGVLVAWRDWDKARISWL